MSEFETISGYRRARVRPGSRLRVAYLSSDRKSTSTTTARATVDKIDDNDTHVLVWLDVDGREPTYTLSLFNTDSNLHCRDKRGCMRTVNDIETTITAEPIDEG